MLTVLVKKPNDTEVVYECSSVEKEANAVLLRGENLGSGDYKGLEILGPGGQTMAWDWDRSVPCEFDKLSKPADIFVMNERGKTIVRYNLFPSLDTIKQGSDTSCEPKKKIVGILANDVSNVIYRTEEKEVYYKTDVDVALLDISRSFTGFGRYDMDRGTIVESGCQITSIILTVSKKDSSDTSATFVVHLHPVNLPQFLNIHGHIPGENPYIERLKATRLLEITENTKVISKDQAMAGVIAGYLTKAVLSVTLEGELNRGTGVMRVSQPDSNYLGDYTLNVVAYSVQAYYSNE